MTLNTNWPVLVHAWGPRWTVNAATVPLDRYVDISTRSRSGVALQRGRQYEFDQLRSGSVTTTWSNDGAFDPANTAGPWYGHVSLFQPYHLLAQWPPTQNLLTPVQATGGDSGGYSTGTIPQGNTGIAVASSTDSGGGTITASGTAWQGARVLQFAVPASTASTSRICSTSQPAVAPGLPYAHQLRVRNVTASTSLQVAAFIAWYDAADTLLTTTVGSTATLTGSGTAAWTQATVTDTAPATTAYATVGVRTAATSPGSSVNVQVDGWQLEQASAVTTWTAPGTWYPLYSGFVDRLPQQWSMSGTYGTVQPQVYDAFALFSQKTLRDPLTEEIFSRSPRFLYTLGDPSGSTTFADAAGKNPSAVATVSKYGAGTLSCGTAITASSASGGYVGSSGTVVTLANPSPGQNVTTASTFVSLSAARITGPASPSGTWSRMIAFRYTAGTPSYAAFMWSCMDNQRAADQPSGSRLLWMINNTGKFAVSMYGPTGATATYTATGVANTADSNWHLAIVSYDHTAAKIIVSIDGATNTFTGVSSTLEPTGLISDNVGAYADPMTNNGTVSNWQGDISFAGEFPTALTTTDITTLYNAWRSAFSGDSSNARYARILAWAGYTGPTSLQTGVTTAMGPAAVGGQDALSALQSVVDTENGNHYIAGNGTVTFKSRGDRYNSLTPTWTFGENTASGEIPYEDLVLDFDATHVANRADITHAPTGQILTASDTTSSNAYFPRPLTRTINTATTQECLDAANYLVSRYKTPATRIASLTLKPSANPSLLWPVCLALELGTRIRVMRRPPSPAAAIQIDCFVESINWRIDDRNNATVTLQCSPVDTTPYGLFASFHTQLNASIGSGVTSVVIKNGQDNTNPAAAQLAFGQQLVLGLGTANQETVTIKSVGTTTAGWTTATITLQAATTKSHTANDIVCEPLPSGVTDATTWDNVSKFDASAFAY